MHKLIKDVVSDHDAPLVIDEEDNEAAAEGDMNNALGSRNNGDNLVIHNRINQGQGHNLNARPYKATSSNGGGGGGGGTRSALFPMPPPPAPRLVACPNVRDIRVITGFCDFSNSPISWSPWWGLPYIIHNFFFHILTPPLCQQNVCTICPQIWGIFWYFER